MPAITVDDVTVLPRLKTPGLGDQPRPVWQVSTAPQGFEGEGFPVRRAFAGIDLAHLDPFIMMDQMGEVEYAPGEPKGTPWHPHRGFETVTYIIDGTFDHQDSHGGGGTITNGDTQWMTAGSGILHIEAPPEWLVQSGRALPRSPAVGQPAPGRQAQRPEVPGHPLGRGRPRHDVRRRRAGAHHRRCGRRRAGARLDVHADGARARDPGARQQARAAVEPGVQRARLRARRQGQGRHRRPPGPTGQAVVFGAGDYLTITADGRRRAGRRRSTSSWSGPPDPGAAGMGRPVRDEHEGRGAGGLRGLPEGPLRAHPRPALIRR